MYYRKFLLPLTLAVSGLLVGGNSWAATTTDSVVYESVNIFQGQTLSTDKFQVGQAGTYLATLTDFEFPNPLASVGLNVTTSTDSFAALTAPGSVTFSAGPGDYYVSLFATAQPVYAEDERNSLIAQQEKQRGDDWWHSLTRDEKSRQKALWSTWSSDDWKDHQAKVWDENASIFDRGMNQGLGQYGVKIALLGSGPSPVPVPAAAWLMVSGLLGFAGVMKKKPV